MKLPGPFIHTTDYVNAIIEIPKGTRNKYAYDEATETMKLKKALPAGMVFSFDFGFIPSTMAGDGDPLDILVLTDAPTFPGCLVECRILGIIQVEQDKDGKKIRNDRIIGVPLESRTHFAAKNIDDLQDDVVKNIVNFFASYNHCSDDEFRAVGNEGPEEALELILKCVHEAD